MTDHESTDALVLASAPADDSAGYKMLWHQAKVAIRSGLLPDAIKTPEQAFIIMRKAEEMGIKPMYALSNIAVINGKPTCSAELLLNLIYRDHGDDAYAVEETTDEICRVSYKRRGWTHRRQFQWTIAQAKRAGLLDQKTKEGRTIVGNWSKYPDAMLRARCASAIARMAFPDSIGGLYTAEEMGADTVPTDDGSYEIVEAAPAPGRAITDHGGITEHEPAPIEPDVAEDDPTELTLRDRAAMHIAELADILGEDHQRVLSEILRAESIRGTDWNRFGDAELETIDRSACKQLLDAEANRQQGAFDMPETAWR